MAVFDINKITLPDGNVCNLMDTKNLPSSDYNYIKNSLPFYQSQIKCEDAWYFSSTPSGVFTRTFGPFEWSWTATSPTSSARTQIQKIMCENGVYYGGVNLTDLHDGDNVTISFEYISDQSLYTWCDLYVTLSGSEIKTSEAWPNGRTALESSSSWKQVWIHQTIPTGWDAALSSISDVVKAAVAVELDPTTTGSFKMRRVMLTKSQSESSWMPNPGDVAGVIGTRNCLLNSWPRRWLNPGSGLWSPGVIASYNDTGYSQSYNNGYVQITCSSYTSHDLHSLIEFNKQYNSKANEDTINLDLSDFHDGDAFTLSVEVKSSTDFYWEGRILARPASGTSDNDVVSWAWGEKEQLVRGDGKWHRVFVSGIIPTGFMALYNDTSTYWAGILFSFKCTASGQTINARKFMMNKGLAHLDWIPGDLDTSGGVFYYDDAAGTNYTIGSTNYSAITKPSVFDLTQHQIVGVAVLNWTSNSGPFWVAPYATGSTYPAYLIGASGTSVQGLKLRWFYTYKRSVTNI